jgi:hypothetical protein
MQLIPEVDGTSDQEAQRIAEGAGIGITTARRVVRGELDTATGACTDYEHSPFTPDGPCAVSFLFCFGCQNAVALARHLPRIVYLHQVMESLRSAVDGQVWAADWATHYSRVSDFLNHHTRVEQRPELLAKLEPGDRELIDAMLERRLDP